jgi:hypothetical protein
MSPSVPTVTQVTRRNLFDAIAHFDWSGRMDDLTFLTRLYDLKTMRSEDHRHTNAAEDIWQHCVNHRDWENDWVFTDARFDLLRCPDNEILRFLCEMLHPLVRPDLDQVEQLVSIFNEHLKTDGWEIVPQMHISNRPVFSPRRRLLVDHSTTTITAIATALSTDYISRQIARLQAESDPELAIGTAKELIETICKAILDARGAPYDPAWEVSQLVKATVKVLKLAPDDVPASAKGANAIRVLLSNLAAIAGRLAELRNLYGTGHGKAPSAQGLKPRHARLAVGAAVTLVSFLFETHQERASS